MFALNSNFGEIRSLEASVKELTQANGAHIHGLAVMSKEWFIRQKPFRNPHEFVCRERYTGVASGPSDPFHYFLHPQMIARYEPAEAYERLRMLKDHVAKWESELKQGRNA